MLGELIPLIANSGVAVEIAKNGSPMLVRAAGRMLGLGEGEQAALRQGRIPWWVWAAGGIAAGFYAGVQVYKRYPEHVPEFVKGKDG